MSLGEELVVQRAIKGDDEAFLMLIHQYKVDLYKTAYSYLKNEEDCLEAIQEVTFRAYRSMNDLREPAYVKTWLMRIMINYCNDVVKKKKRMVLNEDILHSQGRAENYVDLELQDAMESLDDRSREILTLKYFHDLKIKEIAATLDRPEGTVKTWLHQALKLLRNKLEDKEGASHE